MKTLAQLRKLVLGETWTLPLAVAAAIAVVGVLSAAARHETWFHRGGGLVLLALVIAGLYASLRPARR